MMWSPPAPKHMDVIAFAWAGRWSSTSMSSASWSVSETPRSNPVRRIRKTDKAPFLQPTARISYVSSLRASRKQSTVTAPSEGFSDGTPVSPARSILFQSATSPSLVCPFICKLGRRSRALLGAEAASATCTCLTRSCMLSKSAKSLMFWTRFTASVALLPAGTNRFGSFSFSGSRRFGGSKAARTDLRRAKEAAFNAVSSDSALCRRPWGRLTALTWAAAGAGAWIGLSKSFMRASRSCFRSSSISRAMAPTLSISSSACASLDACSSFS
mmetsp:Transcript_57796/g.135451  ORF Transcript_57796/g.135451 Transcript_57796/m.135451 type:complete len:271 (-) Transcript_57796:413-1225(-)